VEIVKPKRFMDALRENAAKKTVGTQREKVCGEAAPVLQLV
jgi:hypothetical protein